MYFNLSCFIPAHETSDWHIRELGQSVWELPSTVTEVHIVHFPSKHTGSVLPHISPPQLQVPTPLASAWSHVSLEASHIVVVPHLHSAILGSAALTAHVGFNGVQLLWGSATTPVPAATEQAWQNPSLLQTLPFGHVPWFSPVPVFPPSPTHTRWIDR